MVPNMSLWWRRVLPACAGGILFFALTVLWLTGAHKPYMDFFALLGIGAFAFPFLDTHAILAAVECHRLGVDIYVNNPCDVLGRPHVYSPVWMLLSVLPVTTTWTVPVGLVLDLSFLVSLLLLPPARRWVGTLVVAAAVVSPAVVYALERGNNDLLMFLFAMLAGRLALRSSSLRLLGHIVVVLAAALKFYPVTLLILASRERWLRCVIVTALSLGLLAAALLADEDSLIRGLRVVPSGLATFGAKNIPTFLAMGLDWPSWSGVLMQATMMLAMAFMARRWATQLQPGLMRLSDAERVSLTVGATLIVGCFLAGQSAGYRAIHLLFTLPPLLALAAGADGKLARVAVALALFAMWGGALRTASGPVDQLLWMTQQYAWWALVTLLLASLLAMLRDSVALQSLPTLPLADPDQGTRWWPGRWHQFQLWRHR